jgi:TP901 family phage tail tape measure protein
MSKQMGVSTETLSAWDYAAEQAGSSLETMTSTMFRLQMKLGQGGEETAASIKKLGLNLDELAGGDPGEAFMQILDSLGKIPDQSERTAAGFELFGRQWKSISQLATEDMRGLMEEAGQLGLVMSDEAAKMGDDLGDMWTKLEKTWEGVTRRLGTALMPSMLEAITSFQETFQNALEATGVAALDWQEIRGRLDRHHRRGHLERQHPDGPAEVVRG